MRRASVTLATDTTLFFYSKVVRCTISKLSRYSRHPSFFRSLSRLNLEYSVHKRNSFQCYVKLDIKLEGNYSVLEKFLTYKSRLNGPVLCARHEV